MFFCKATPESSLALRTILQHYEEISGQRINSTKSTITFSSKTPREVKNAVRDSLGIAREGGLGKYLGLPESFTRKKKDIFSGILDRIRHHIVSWSTRFLSAAGKLTLLKSVLSSIPNYAMMCFKLPVSLCKRIQSLLTRFWWDSNSGKRKMSWVAWRKLASPKAVGGLGLGDIQLFNDALLAKQGWRILKRPDSLFVRLLLSKYCREEMFLECTPSSSASHGWRSILVGRDLLKSQLIKLIGNGCSTHVWTEPWIPSIPLKKPHGPVLEDMNSMMVSDLIDDETGTWKKETIDQIFPQLTEAIMSIKCSKSGAPDQIIWNPSVSGVYSTKSGYFSAVATADQPAMQMNPNQALNWTQNVWSLPCAPKIKLFMWKVFNNSVPTGEALNSRGVQSCITCPRCGAIESLRHILFDCIFARELWSLSQWKEPFHIQEGDVTPQILDAMKLTSLPPTGIGTKSLVPWLLWHIWKARNLLIFQQRHISTLDVYSKASREAREWFTAQQTQATVNSGPRVSPTHSERENEATIVSSDAAWNQKFNVAGLGCCYSLNTPGVFLQYSEVSEHVCSPLIGEGLAVLAALRRAAAAQLSRVKLVMDSKECYEAIIKQHQHRELYGIVCDIHNLSSSFISVSFGFIPRKENVYADSVAKSALCEFVFELELNSV